MGHNGGGEGNNFKPLFKTRKIKSKVMRWEMCPHFENVRLIRFPTLPSYANAPRFYLCVLEKRGLLSLSALTTILYE